MYTLAEINHNKISDYCKSIFKEFDIQRIPCLDDHNAVLTELPKRILRLYINEDPGLQVDEDGYITAFCVVNNILCIWYQYKVYDDKENTYIIK